MPAFPPFSQKSLFKGAILLSTKVRCFQSLNGAGGNLMKEKIFIKR
jgi:hypothetical protein